MRSLCSVNGCELPSLHVGMCRGHYKRLRKYGDATINRNPNRGKPQQWIDEHATWTGGDCLIWPFSKCRGYGVVNRSVGDVRRPVKVSRMMCEFRNGPPPTESHEAAHTCGKGNIGCVNPQHLVWKTHSENMADTVLHGTSTRGERNPTAKFSASDIRTIRSSDEARQALAARFGTTPNYIDSIRAGRVWSWLVM